MENINTKLIISFVISLVELIFEYLSFNYNNYIYSVVALVLAILSLLILLYIRKISENFAPDVKQLLKNLIYINVSALITSVSIIVLYVTLSINKPNLHRILNYISSALFYLQNILLLLLIYLNRKSYALQLLLKFVFITILVIFFLAIYFSLQYLRYSAYTNY
jgi:hypothetical protein